MPSKHNLFCVVLWVLTMSMGCDIVNIKRSSSFERNTSTPILYLEVLFVWLDRNVAVLKLYQTFLGESQKRRGEVCACMCGMSMCGMHLQYLYFSVEKTGCAVCAFLKWAAESCWGIVTMETEMEIMLKTHRTYWHRKKQKKKQCKETQRMIYFSQDPKFPMMQNACAVWSRQVSFKCIIKISTSLCLQECCLSDK